MRQPAPVSLRRGKSEDALHLPVLRTSVAQVVGQVPRLRIVELARRGGGGQRATKACVGGGHRLFETNPAPSGGGAGGRAKANRNPGAGSGAGRGSGFGIRRPAGRRSGNRQVHAAACSLGSALFRGRGSL